jgi:alkanesulfonate monooxygenase SsuD/methylene tetrahydromethanopterin reductase-like flavin-dependent oxidoreductase (luciferase family)
VRGGLYLEKLEFGIKVPTLSEEGIKGKEFINSIQQYLSEVPPNFTTLWVSDHLMTWVMNQPENADALECWSVMSYLLGTYPHMKVGSGVLCNSFRNPALLAKMAATLADLAPERLILGIGAGWSEVEYKGYGYPFPRAAVRIGQLEEAVQIIKKMWTEDQVTFLGKYYTIHGARCFPRPDPAPPIMIGGSGEQLTLRVVAKYADWWNGHAQSIEHYQHKLNVLERHCNNVGRDYESIIKTIEGFVAIASNRNTAKKIAQRGRQAHFCGTPNDIIAQVQEYLNLGIKHFMLRFLDQPHSDGLKLFAEQVIPSLQT